MRTVEVTAATDSLSAYVRSARHDVVIVTRRGRPVAAVVSINGMDLESLSLSTNPDFVALIERSRARCRAEGGVPLEEVRRRYARTQTRKKGRRAPTKLSR